MIGILNNFKYIAELLKKFLVLLGPNFKAVTGNSENIDELINKVKSLIDIFDSFPYSYFDSQFKSAWQTIFSKFKAQSKDIETQTIKLIQATFSDLRSSESAFELLYQFKNLETLQVISDNLQRRYSDV